MACTVFPGTWPQTNYSMGEGTMHYHKISMLPDKKIVRAPPCRVQGS